MDELASWIELANCSDSVRPFSIPVVTMKLGVEIKKKEINKKCRGSVTKKKQEYRDEEEVRSEGGRGVKLARTSIRGLVCGLKCDFPASKKSLS